MKREPSDNGVTLAMLRVLAVELLADAPEGEQLELGEAALVAFGVAAAVTSLDGDAIDARIATCFATGAAVAQVQEVVSLVSGLGVHSLMAAATRIVAQARIAGVPILDSRTADQEQLWARYVGDDSYWLAFDRELPGFLDAMLRLSPGQFSAFFDYCAVPWASGSIRAQLKELIAMATDATPAHRFLPGFRLHLGNAIKLGAGRAAVMQCLDIAAQAPPHRGAR